MRPIPLHLSEAQRDRVGTCRRAVAPYVDLLPFALDEVARHPDASHILARAGVALWLPGSREAMERRARENRPWPTNEGEKE